MDNDFINIVAALQNTVTKILSNDSILSSMGAEFASENALDIEFQVGKALKQQGLACMVMTPKMTYQGHNGAEQVWTVDDLRVQCVENPIVNRARLKKEGKTAGTALDVAVQVQRRLAGPQGGNYGRFTSKGIEQKEMDGLLVAEAIFQCTIHSDVPPTSCDISGNWCEIPYIRISDLSDFIDDYLSTHMPAVEGYLPLSGGAMSGDITFQSNNGLFWGDQDNHDAYIMGGSPGLVVYNDADEQWRFKSSSLPESEDDVLRRRDLSAVDVPTKVSELSNDVGYITSVQVEPTMPTPSTTPDYYLNGSALKALKAFSLVSYLISSQGAVENQQKYMSLPQTGAPIVYFNGENPFLLSSVDDITYNAELVYDYVQSFIYRVGGRPRQYTLYRYCWTGNNWYLTKNNDDLSGLLIYNRVTAPPLTYNIVFSNDKLSVSSVDGQATIICTRDSTGNSTTGWSLAFQKDVVKINNTSALTITVPYDNGFTLQTPNGTSLLKTIDLNRTAIESLSAGNVEVGTNGSVVRYTGDGETPLSAWNWLKTNSRGLGDLISSEHNSILGEVSEDFVSFNWLIQQGYVTSGEISAKLGQYLPLSGGQMSGGIGWDYGGMGGPQIYGPYTPQHLAFTTTYQPDAQKMVFLDFGRIEEANGQRTIAYVEDIDAVLGDLSALIHAT